MKANEVILNNFLSQSKTQFVIPVYQRNYDWLEHQCTQLFDDIIQVGSKYGETHFIGSIVYIHDGVYTSSEVKKLVIIDGQQRLTTFSLLYLALYKFALRNGLDEDAEEIKQEFLTNKFVKDDGSKLKLKQSDINAHAFNFIVNENDPTKYPHYSRVIENFTFFYEKINHDNFKIIRRGIAGLLFVEISLERGKDDPQKIFESLNSTGLELSQADLIRNYILMGLEPDEQIRVFNNFWEIIEANARDNEKEESRVSDFIRDYLTFKTKKIPNKNKVYDEFKLRYPSRDKSFYVDTLTELKEFSYHYSKLINPSKESDSSLRRELEYIQKLEINISYPFLMPVLEDFRNGIIDRDELKAILKLIQSYVWRRFMVNLTTASINKVFMTLYSEVNTKEYVESVEKALVKKKGTMKFPLNQEVEIAMIEKDVYNIQAKNRTYFFELLENHNNREFVSVENPDITIEHIFPQNPEERWFKQLSDQDYKLLAEKYLHSIANLTLSGNNGSLSNKTFQDKKTMNSQGREQGYIFSRLWLNQYLSKIDEWNVEKLKERYNLLLQRFFEIWPYPEVDADEELEADEDFTIYNAPDPRNRKLDYFIFRDQKIETEEVSKMYSHVIQQLYNENPSAFYHQEIKELLGLSADKENFRSCYPLSPTLYMETGLDNNSKFRKLRGLLPKFNAEEDLLINYSAENLNAIIFDPEYWSKKTSPEILSTVHQCFQLIQELDPGINLQYRVRYIGLQKNGSVNNFVLFVPSPSFIRVVVKLPDCEHWADLLKQRSMELLSINRKGKRLKFRLHPHSASRHRDLLKEMFATSYNHWMN